MEATNIVPSNKIKAHVSGLFSTFGDDFQTRGTDKLELDFSGLKDDRHSGITRFSGGREPWYPRGTEIRNERQLTIVTMDELQSVANDMGIDQIRPEWIGANVVLKGVKNLSMLPASSLLMFENGVTLKIDFQNKPCKIAGASIAQNFPDMDQQALALAFPKHAKHRRGLISWVEKPGTLSAGENVTIKIPEQWIYTS